MLHKTLLYTLLCALILVFLSVEAVNVIQDDESVLGYDEEDEDEEEALEYDADEDEQIVTAPVTILQAKTEEQQTQEADTRVLFVGASASSADTENGAISPVSSVSEELTQGEATVQVQ